ncbi:MAG: CinA family protein [Candidatus Thermoplasmatota archaeon]
MKPTIEKGENSFMVDEEVLSKLYDVLTAKKLKVATAESCTGGLIGHTLTNTSGSSTYFDRGVISYSNAAKIELLGVSKKILEEHGAVSREVAKAMAEGIRKKSGVDLGVSSTGIAGPTGGTKEKPVGLVYIGVSDSNETVVKKFVFDKDRLGNKKCTRDAAVEMLLEKAKKI